MLEVMSVVSDGPFVHVLKMIGKTMDREGKTSIDSFNRLCQQLETSFRQKPSRYNNLNNSNALWTWERETLIPSAFP